MSPEISSELAKALPVILGGALAIFGGVIGQIITHRFTEKRERDALLRNRIELLVKSLYAHSQWLEDHFNSSLIRNEDHDAPSPLAEARMLQKLYFPSLGKELHAVMSAQIPMLKFIGEQRVERLKDFTSWIKAFNRDPYDKMYRVHLEALENATAACRAKLDGALAN